MPIEIEKKFLVVSPPSLMENGIPICQGYMTRKKEMTSRIRIYGDQGFITVKGPAIKGVRTEFEYPIPLDDARQMLDLFCLKPFIEKTRFHTAYKGFDWVIDCFSGENQGLVVAEIELTGTDTFFEKPPWAGPEVTHDPRYFNSNLVRYPYRAWKDKPQI